MERVIFYIIALVMIVFAFMSVMSRNIMRAIIFLLFVMLGFAGLYFMMEFYFLGAVQMTVYAGGIIILYINSIMLIEMINNPLQKPKVMNVIISSVLSSVAAGMSIFAIADYAFEQRGSETATTISQVGKALLSTGDNGFILPFEVISILLLAAMIGAIVIAKTYKKKPIENQ